MTGPGRRDCLGTAVESLPLREVSIVPMLGVAWIGSEAALTLSIARHLLHAWILHHASHHLRIGSLGVATLRAHPWELLLLLRRLLRLLLVIHHLLLARLASLLLWGAVVEVGSSI